MPDEGDNTSKSAEPAQPAPVLDYSNPAVEQSPSGRDRGSGIVRVLGIIWMIMLSVWMVGLSWMMFMIIVASNFPVAARAVCALLLLFFLAAAWAGVKLARARMRGG